MPSRIKPVHDLGSCTLNLENIKGICALIDKEFGHSFYAAEDDIWIVYNEPTTSFLQAIDERDRLDSFTAFAVSPSSKGPGTIIYPSLDRSHDVDKAVELIFNKDIAQISFNIGPDDNYWLEHFLLDLDKHISSPTFLQKFSGIPIPIVFLSSAVVIPISLPYCRIILKSDQPNQRLIAIEDNITASIIYDILKFIIGAIMGIFSLWVLNRYEINILE